MKRVTIGAVIVSAALAFLPGVAAAQCEGGTSTAGYYLRDGSYVPGGCAFTNTTTPGQLYPSGAQPLPSTNPAMGTSALPGQPIGTGLLPVRAGDFGQPLGATGAPGQNLGPGAGGVSPVITLPQNATITGVNALPGQVSPSGILPVNTANVGGSLGFRGISNGLTNTVNNGAATGVTTPNINGWAPPVTPANVGPGVSYVTNSAVPVTTNTAAGLGLGGPINAITSTRGLSNTIGADTTSGVVAVPAPVIPPLPVVQSVTSNAAVTAAAPASVSVSPAPASSAADELVDRAPLRIVPITPYSYSLQPAPAVSAAAASPSAPSASLAPPVPGRGGPTYIGEDRGSPDQVIVSTP